MPNNAKTVVTIGKFDVLHLGHAKIFLKMIATIKKATKNGQILTPCVVVISPNPLSFFRPDVKICDLYSFEERRDIISNFFKKHNYDLQIINQKFNSEFVVLTKQNFVDMYLKNDLNADSIVCGDGFCFGKGRLGDVKFLSTQMRTFVLRLHCGGALGCFGLRHNISSTQIKNLISDGKIKQANSLMISKYTISGIVVCGKRIAGQALGFKTANIDLSNVAECKVIPKYGVYKTTIFIGDLVYRGISNIGIKPSISDEKKLTLETHIFDFNADLYGKIITVQFDEFFRDEKKFESIEALKRQIMRDITYCRSLKGCAMLRLLYNILQYF